LVLYYSCFSLRTYRKDLHSDNHDAIDYACYKLGEAKDTAAIKLLLIKILDPRMSTNLHFKGMTVNFCKPVALRKITGAGTQIKFNRFIVDTASSYFYLDWAIRNSYIKSKDDIDIYYYK
jgi:hypothetical protein